MVLLFYADYCLISIPFKDKIDEVYDSLQAYFKIVDYGELNKYLGMKLDLRPYGTIYLRQPYLPKIILTGFQE